MMDLKPLTAADAPEGSRETLSAVEKQLGFIPNILGIFAHAPAALNAYATIDGLLDRSSLDAAQKTTVLLAASRQNGCGYCMAAHSAGAPLDEAALEALREGKPLPDPKLEALRRFTERVVDTRGYVEHADIKAFLDAGFEQPQVLDVLTAVALKTLSNYANHILETPLDTPLQQFAWRETG